MTLDGHQDRFTRSGLSNEGLEGFVTVSALVQPQGRDVLPHDPGLYVAFREALDPPRFIDPGTGGWFKGTDPNVRVGVLEAKWVPDATVVYIGMASSLATRVGQLIKFGHGRAIGHKGGRYLWQLVDSAELRIAWKVHDDPRTRESELLAAFTQAYGVLPFANLRW